MLEKLKGYKTVTFFVIALAVALANLFGFGDFQMTPEQLRIFEVVVPVAGLILRYFTDSGIFNGSKS